MQEEGIILPGGKSQLKKDGSGIDVRYDNDDGIAISPTPGFVLKTKTKEASKVFINICYHDDIEKPGQKKKLDNDGNEVEGLNVPLSMSPIRACNDNMNNECLVVDAAVHSAVKDDIEGDQTGSHRDLLCTIMIQCFDQKYPSFAPLDRKYNLPRLKYIGFVNVKTGEVVRKQSGKETEVCKQYIRSRTQCPRIEEIKTSQKDKETEMTESKKSSKKDDEEQSELCYDIYVDTSSKQELILNDFIQQADKILDSKQIDVPLISSLHKKDRGLTLLQDPIISENLKASFVKVCFSLPSYDEATEVESSPYMFTVRCPTHKTTHVILPFCIDTTTTEALYDENMASLTVKASVCESLMEDSIDIGSRPWILARGLSSVKRTRNSTDNKNIKESVPDSNKDSREKNELDLSDPYHTRPLYVSASDVINLRNQVTHKEGTENSKLPEDRFHATDTLSQHWIQQQEKERQEKLEKKEIERKDRSPNDCIEYVNAHDFKPGGKYFMEDSKGKLSNRASSKQEEHLKTLEKAEAVIRKNYEPRLKCTWWSKLF